MPCPWSWGRAGVCPRVWTDTGRAFLLLPSGDKRSVVQGAWCGALGGDLHWDCVLRRPQDWGPLSLNLCFLPNTVSTVIVPMLQQRKDRLRGHPSFCMLSAVFLLFPFLRPGALPFPFLYARLWN